MSIKITTEDFIKKVKQVHGDTYDYSLVDYKSQKNKVVIICKLHGKFSQTPECHTNKGGCPICANYKRGAFQRSSTEDFISKARIIHGNTYDYSKVNYKDSQVKVTIICKVHGEFLQSPTSHLNVGGCYYCGIKKQSDSLRSNLKDFILKAKEVHDNIYDYSKVKYTTANTKVIIICKKHGEFLQAPYNHLSGTGCPVCSSSQGEKKIAKYLKEKNVLFEQEKKFIDCKYVKPLPFDFYLPQQNIFIEFQGVQHYRECFFIKTSKDLELRQLKDSIKRNYAKKHGTFIEIKYNEDVKEKLDAYFK